MLPDDFRTAAAAALVIGALAACQDSAGPFRPAPGSVRELTLPPGSQLRGAAAETPEYVVAAPAGAPPQTAAKLAAAFAVALRNYGIVATTEPSGSARAITAVAQAAAINNPHVSLDLTWTASDMAAGHPVTYRQRTLADAEAWERGEDSLVSRIAAQAAFHISRQLGRGHPDYVPLAALPDVLGPGDWPASPSIPETEGPPPGQQATAPPPLPGQRTPAIAASQAPRVLVATLAGPSGEAGRALAAAMRRALGESQLVLVDRPETGAFQVHGSVEVSPPAEGSQRVIIRWVVKRSDGTAIGDLEQANTVRAGSLDGNWAKLAPIVAEAAVDSVVELIQLERARR